jgi:hypothetical protein
MRGRQLLALVVLAIVVILAAGALALSQTGTQPAPAGSSPQSAKSSKKQAAPQGPEIVRWVCNDHICGGCDGNCSRHGHVATDKGGHCACTPNEGSALDKAIRKAFQGHEKGQ